MIAALEILHNLEPGWGEGSVSSMTRTSGEEDRHGWGDRVNREGKQANQPALLRTGLATSNGCDRGQRDRDHGRRDHRFARHPTSQAHSTSFRYRTHHHSQADRGRRHYGDCLLY